MKRIAIVFLLSHLYLHAQVNITSAAMPSNGDTLRYSVAALDSIVLSSYQTSGPNQVWNFDSLIPLRQGISEYINSKQTPYTSIPSRIGEKVADTVSLGGINLYDVYNFYNNTPSSFSKEYQGATILTNLLPLPYKIDDPFSDKDEVYQFPLDYLDRDSSTFDFVFTLPFPFNLALNVYYGSGGYRINEADAWGTLTTPYGTFNCLRVVTDIVGYDTVQFDTTGFGLSSHRREYKWLSPNVKIPVLSVNGLVVGGTFVPNTVQYRDSVRPGVPNLFSPLALFTADNTNGVIGDTINITNATISLTTPNYRWSIHPNNFQYVNATSATSDNISVVFNQTGLYSVQLFADNGIGKDSLLIRDYIQINNSGNSRIPTSAFSTLIQDISLNDSLNFINRSVDDTATLWAVSPSSYSYANNTDSLSRSPTISFIDTGLYSISLISYNSFGSDTLERLNYIKVSGSSSLNEFSNSIQFKIYPNPIAKGGSITIENKFKSEIKEISLYSIEGRLINNLKISLSENNYIIEIPRNIDSGLYLIVLSNQKNKFIKKVFID